MAEFRSHHRLYGAPQVQLARIGADSLSTNLRPMNPGRPLSLGCMLRLVGTGAVPNISSACDGSACRDPNARVKRGVIYWPSAPRLSTTKVDTQDILETMMDRLYGLLTGKTPEEIEARKQQKKRAKARRQRQREQRNREQDPLTRWKAARPFMGVLGDSWKP